MSNEDLMNHELLKPAANDPAPEPNVTDEPELPFRDEQGKFTREASQEQADEVPEETEETVEAAEDSDESADDVDESEEPESKEEPEERSARKRSAAQRISQLTAQRREAEARAQQAERQLLELQEYLQQQVDPNLEFDDPQKFTQENVRRALAEQRYHDTYVDLERSKQQQLQSNRDAFMERLETMRDELPDFDQVFTPQTPVSEYGVKFLAESEIGPKIAHHLGRNPSLASRIANMEPADQGAELARLEYQLRTPPPKRTSKAPKPIKPVVASGSAGVFDPQRSGVEDFKRMIYGKGKT